MKVERGLSMNTGRSISRVGTTTRGFSSLRGESAAASNIARFPNVSIIEGSSIKPNKLGPRNSTGYIRGLGPFAIPKNVAVDEGPVGGFNIKSTTEFPVNSPVISKTVQKSAEKHTSRVSRTSRHRRPVVHENIGFRPLMFASPKQEVGTMPTEPAFSIHLSNETVENRSVDKVNGGGTNVSILPNTQDKEADEINLPKPDIEVEIKRLKELAAGVRLSRNLQHGQEIVPRLLEITDPTTRDIIRHGYKRQVNNVFWGIPGKASNIEIESENEEEKRKERVIVPPKVPSLKILEAPTQSTTPMLKAASKSTVLTQPKTEISQKIDVKLKTKADIFIGRKAFLVIQHQQSGGDDVPEDRLKFDRDDPTNDRRWRAIELALAKVKNRIYDRGHEPTWGDVADMLPKIPPKPLMSDLAIEVGSKGDGSYSELRQELSRQGIIKRGKEVVVEKLVEMLTAVRRRRLIKDRVSKKDVKRVLWGASDFSLDGS